MPTASPSFTALSSTACCRSSSAERPTADVLTTSAIRGRVSSHPPTPAAGARPTVTVRRGIRHDQGLLAPPPIADHQHPCRRYDGRARHARGHRRDRRSRRHAVHRGSDPRPGRVGRRREGGRDGGDLAEARHRLPRRHDGIDGARSRTSRARSRTSSPRSATNNRTRSSARPSTRTRETSSSTTSTRRSPPTTPRLPPR